MNGILRNWESLCDIRSDCHHHFDASGTSNAMFDELAERSLMSPLAGTRHTYVRLAIIIYCQILALFFFFKSQGFVSFIILNSAVQQINRKYRLSHLIKHSCEPIYLGGPQNGSLHSELN